MAALQHRRPLGAGVVKRATPPRRRPRAHLLRRPGHDARPRARASTRARSIPAPRPRPCAATCSPATGSRSPPAGRTARSCRRPSSTRSPRRRRRNPSEIPSLYDVAVFENRSPSFGPALAAAHGDAPAGRRRPARASTTSTRPASGRTRTSVGRCEVVCFSPEHAGSFGTQTPTRARTVIEAWADRTAALSALPGIEQVFPFENRGEAIGVTLAHPHGQIYAYPYITPRTRRLLEVDRPRGRRPLRPHPRVRARVGARHPRAASTGPRSCRSPRAGRSRCT